MTSKNILCNIFMAYLMMQSHTAVASGPSIVFTCKNSDYTRIIEAKFSEGGSAPCEVNYKKIDEEPGISQTLWTSRFSSQYCIEKLDAFIEKQRGWGWVCHTTELGVPVQERD